MKERKQKIFPGLDHTGVEIDGVIEWRLDATWNMEVFERKTRSRKRVRKGKAAVPETVAERTVQFELQVQDRGCPYKVGG